MKSLIKKLGGKFKSNSYSLAYERTKPSIFSIEVRGIFSLNILLKPYEALAERRYLKNGFE